MPHRERSRRRGRGERGRSSGRRYRQHERHDRRPFDQCEAPAHDDSFRDAAPLPASRVHPCAGRESLRSASATDQWAFDKTFGAPATSQFVATGTNPNTQSAVADAHAIIAGTSIYDLPRPSHNAHGATAAVFSAGDPFMTGSATFASTRAPVASGGHVCRAGGTLHRFSSLRYTGQLVPNTNALTGVFDTAPVVLTSRHATLVLRQYR
jgi:hypothetical protein